MKRVLFVFLLLALATIGLSDPVKHNYDLLNVLWRLSFDIKAGTIQGDVTNTVTLKEDTSTVEFSCSELGVLEAWVDGVKAQFDDKNDKLTIMLPTPGKAGQTLALRCTYTGSPVNGFYFVETRHAFPAHTPIVYTQGEGEDNHYWLPTYDYPDDKATSESFITVPVDWTPVSNGVLVDRKFTLAGYTWHFRMDQPHSTYLISLVAGPLKKVDDFWSKVPVEYYVPPGLEDEGAASFGSTGKMIEFYSKLTGVPYPYGKFAQEAVPDFMYGGMENITAVTQTVRTLHLPSTEPVNDSTYLVAHELAHQWFGDLITCKTWEHTWLNEGFATTLPVFLNREWHGQDYFDLDRYRNFEGAIDTMGMRGRKEMPGEVGSVPTVTMGSVYDGGCSRILMLYHMMGEETFWKAIHQFLADYSFKNATTDDFFDVMHKVTGKDYSDFKKQWFYSAATPSLTAKMDHNSLVVTQLQPYYTLDLPVWVWSDNAWNKKSIHISGKESKLDLGSLAGKPFLIDPEVWTPMELKYDVPFTDQDVIAMYSHAPNVAQKARIITFLMDKMSLVNRVAMVRDEKFQGLLQMIANHIPQAGMGYLMELTHNDDARVVNAAILAISKLGSDEDVKARLRFIAEYDKNETLQEHATQALLNWSDDVAYAQDVWKRKSFDDGYRVMALDWMAKHQPEIARNMALDEIDAADSEPVRVKALEVLGMVKELPGSTIVYSHLLAVAAETSYRARIAAITSLGQLGNKKAITVLQPYTQHGPGGVRGAAQTAIDLLKKA